MSPQQPLGWSGIVRLGLAQTALGAVVVLMTSTINRVMAVELALPAVVPGLLVALHYGVQILRPAWGYGADGGGRRTPWIIGGMAALALGGAGAALGTVVAASNLVAGLALATVAFILVGAGVGAAGTSVLTLLATRVAPNRRAAAATTVWVMMIFGFVVTAQTAGHFLDPFSYARLLAVTMSVAAIAFVAASLAVLGLEGRPESSGAAVRGANKATFLEAFAEVWAEPAARRFAIFIFVSMLAYGVQELLIEPFAAKVFAMAPGATTQLAGVQHGGVLVGMIGVGLVASLIGGPRLGSLRLWTIGGCLGSAASLAAIAASPLGGAGYPLRAAIFALGLSNGVFAVAAIGSMMGLAGSGAGAREGTRMGLWGAAQAIAFGLGDFLGPVAVDIVGHAGQSAVTAYPVVFVAEALLFLVAAVLAHRVSTGAGTTARGLIVAATEQPVGAGL
ncbi:MAG: BCD family MFS transporter [Roseiarcus sp.]|jgi:BCD family chlorophyll transporter-like MFS transporter